MNLQTVGLVRYYNRHHLVVSVVRDYAQRTRQPMK